MRAGFSNPVHDSQRTYRSLLSAMAEPGIWQPIVQTAEPLKAEPPGFFSLALTLLDNDTRFFSESLAEFAALVRFYTGAQATEAPEADFIFIQASQLEKRTPEALQSFLNGLRQGDDLAPETSATVVLAVQNTAAAASTPLPVSRPASHSGAFIGSSEGRTIAIHGPGIQSQRNLPDFALPNGFWKWRQKQELSYPLGLDLLFVRDHQVMALPRSTRLTLPEGLLSTGRGVS